MHKMFLQLLFVTSFSWESVVLAEDSTSFPPLTARGADFVVHSHRGGPSSAEVLGRCRSLRKELQSMWFGAIATDDWRPRCKIVLHATRASYLQAVGRNGGQTSGSSLIQFKKGRVITRRIDLLADRQGYVSALPHELTHVILADRFSGKQPPRWLDEGIAMMADSTEKQTLHLRDCQHALRTGTALRMFDLLKLEQLKSARQVSTFYGQSSSLVRFLAKHNEPQNVVAFSEVAIDKGYDYALRQCYGINGVVALERMWRNYAMTPGQGKTHAPVTVTEFRP